MSVTISARTLAGFAAGFVVAVIVLFTFHAMTAAAVGSDESTFVPMTPCRLFNRTPINAGTSVEFQVTGSVGECVIPAAATAVSINLTGVAPTAATNLRMYPADADVPSAAVLNMVAGQGAAPNKLDVKLSPDGKIKIYNQFGTIQVVGDVMGYYRHDGLADLESRLAALEADNVALKADNVALKADVASLQSLTASMSLHTVDSQPTVRFSGVNVQVVSGSGTTAGAINGKGNLIVGYNENSFDARIGSHNLIVGGYHAYESYGSLVAGHNNAATGRNTFLAGANNSASGNSSSVSGGGSNTASGNYSSVSGGNGRLVNSNYDWRAGTLFVDF